MSRHNVYRDGRVHLCRQLCDTCIFRSGNLMHLEPGRIGQMVLDAQRDESAIVCHETLDGDNAERAREYNHVAAMIRLDTFLGIIPGERWPRETPGMIVRKGGP
jgi:hypothetical protein